MGKQVHNLDPRFLPVFPRSTPEEERLFDLTELLEQLITEIGKLPAEEQDAIASRILAELADEQEWTTRFNATTDQQWDRLSELARQKLSAAGDTD